MSSDVRGRLWTVLVGILALFAIASRQGPKRRPVIIATRAPADPHEADSERFRAAQQRLLPGALGTGGYYAMWPKTSRDAAVVSHIAFQFADMEHQSDTALSGMWLFLATELLFFGGLFLLYAIYRGQHPAAIAEASRHAELMIGTINTVLLVTSSAIFAYGLGCARQGRNRALYWASLVTLLIGLTFLALKGLEWMEDFDAHLFPGPGFAIHGQNAGAAQLFWSFYFIATGLHGIHMMVGVCLVGWIAWNARKNVYSPQYQTPVEVVGLYWSFVDMVWLVLYPTIYLAGAIGS